MDNKRIAGIGEVHWHDGLPYFLFGQSDNGFIFKDEEAYKNDWDAPCYVPEYAAEDAAVVVDGIEYECGGENCDYYTHNDLLELCCGNREWCDALFNDIDWCYPETRIEEEDDTDISYFIALLNPVQKFGGMTPLEKHQASMRCSRFRLVLTNMVSWPKKAMSSL